MRRANVPTELELKLCVPAAMLPSLRAALLARGALGVRLRAHYFDTPCGALARHQMALRLRLEGRQWVQTLKAAGAGAVHRLEHEVPVPGRPGERPALNLSLHDGSPAAPLLAAALQAAGGAALVERHATDVRRLHCLMVDAAGTHIEAALDAGHALAAGRQDAITELELEHKGGPVSGLFDLAAACVRHGGLWQSTLTKAERGERLRQPRPTWPATPARPPSLPAQADGATLMRALLQSALQQVLANASELAAAGSDGAAPAHAETVHQLRVGLRRLRGLLRDLAALLPPVPAAVTAALADTFAALGRVRADAQLAAAQPPETTAVPLSAEVAAPAGAAVRSAAFQTALLALQALAHADTAAYPPHAPRATRRRVAAVLQRLQERVLRDGRRFDKLPRAQQHRLRKRLKRLRYLADFTQAWWPQAWAQQLRRALGQAQEALGQHRDLPTRATAQRARQALKALPTRARRWR